MIWFAAFATCPAPASPTSVMVLPITCNTGNAFSNASASPPTMMVSVALRAPISPPETGASNEKTPFSFNFSAIILADAGLMVELSITISPARAPSMIPFSPSVTFSTSGESGKLVKIISTCAATSFGEFAAIAPSLTNSSTAARERLCTTTGNPALRILRAIDLPINPRPMYPTFSMTRLLLICLILYIHFQEYLKSYK